MVVANIKDREHYASLHKSFSEVLALLQGLTSESLPGPYEGEGYRINFSGAYADTFDLTPEGKARPFEAHREYIDIHYCIDGCEAIGYNDTSRLTPVTEYFEADDYQLLEGESVPIVLHPGDFCIVFPEDAHIPLCVGDEKKRVLKAIAKIKI